MDAFNELARDAKDVLSEQDIRSYCSKDEPFMKCIKNTLRRRFRIKLEDAVSKSELSRRLIQRRLNEIAVELRNGNYVPKLELEKILYRVRREYLVYHVVL